MWRVALLFAAARGAKLARLSTDDQDGLKEALFGGDCWAVACTDVNDQKTGRDLLAKALDDPVTQSCKGATLACGARLPSGKTSLQRLGISPPQKGHPLIFVAANGEASAVGLREYAVVDEAKNSATPDAGVLAKHLEKVEPAREPISKPPERPLARATSSRSPRPLARATSSRGPRRPRRRRDPASTLSIPAGRRAAADAHARVRRRLQKEVRGETPLDRADILRVGPRFVTSFGRTPPAHVNSAKIGPRFVTSFGRTPPAHSNAATVVDGGLRLSSSSALVGHCVVFAFNSSTATASAMRDAKRFAASLAAKRRTCRVAVADLKTLGAFSLQKALPDGAATALYLRRLAASEKSALAAARAKLAPASAKEPELSASACGAEAVAGKDEATAHKNFEAKKLAPRDWTARSEKIDQLVFRKDGKYVGWGAVGPALAEQALFGTMPKKLDALAARRPLIKPSADAALGAKAFRGASFDAKALDAWLATFLDAARPRGKQPRIVANASTGCSGARPLRAVPFCFLLGPDRFSELFP